MVRRGKLSTLDPSSASSAYTNGRGGVVAKEGGDTRYFYNELVDFSKAVLTRFSNKTMTYLTSPEGEQIT